MLYLAHAGVALWGDSWPKPKNVQQRRSQLKEVWEALWTLWREQLKVWYPIDVRGVATTVYDRWNVTSWWSIRRHLWIIKQIVVETSSESVGQDEWVSVVSDAATPRDRMKLQKLEQCNILYEASFTHMDKCWAKRNNRKNISLVISVLILTLLWIIRQHHPKPLPRCRKYRFGVFLESLLLLHFGSFF